MGWTTRITEREHTSLPGVQQAFITWLNPVFVDFKLATTRHITVSDGFRRRPLAAFFGLVLAARLRENLWIWRRPRPGTASDLDSVALGSFHILAEAFNDRQAVLQSRIMKINDVSYTAILSDYLRPRA